MDGHRPQPPESEVVIVSSDDEDDRREQNEARIEAENRRRMAAAQYRDNHAHNQGRSGSVPAVRQYAPIVPRPAPSSLPERITPGMTPPPELDNHHPVPEISIKEYLLNRERLAAAQSLVTNTPREELRQSSAPPAPIRAPVLKYTRTGTLTSGSYEPIIPKTRFVMTQNIVPIMYPLANASSAPQSRKSSLASQESRSSGNNEPSTSTAHLRKVEMSITSQGSPKKVNHSPLLLALLTEGPDTIKISNTLPAVEASTELTQDFNDIHMENGEASEPHRASAENLGPVEFDMEDFEDPGENEMPSEASVESKDSRASSRIFMDDGSRSSSRQPRDSRASTEDSMNSPGMPEAEEPMEVDTEDVQALEDVGDLEDVMAPEDEQNLEDVVSARGDSRDSEDVQPPEGPRDSEDEQDPEDQSNPEDVVSAPEDPRDSEDVESPEGSVDPVDQPNPEAAPEEPQNPEDHQNLVDVQSTLEASMNSEEIQTPENQPNPEEVKSTPETSRDSEDRQTPETHIKTEDVKFAPEALMDSEVAQSAPGSPNYPEHKPNPEDVKPTSEDAPSVEAASEPDTPSPPTTSGQPKRSHKKKPEKLKVYGEPTRKSTRIQSKADAEKKDEEIPENFKTTDDGNIQDRGIIPPIGLIRRPFHFNIQEEKADRLKNQLHINMQPVFGQIATSSDNIQAPSTRGTKRPGTPESPPPQLPTRGRTLAAPKRRVEPRIHRDNYQLKEEQMPFLGDAPAPKDEPDRDAPMFIPIESLDEADRPQTSDWKNAPDLFYNGILTIYWRAIWRQWQGQIDFDTALQHLMQHNYQMLNALDTIDQKLEFMPQEFKPICMAQARALEKQVKTDKTEKTSLRSLQDKTMRNYHLGEIHNFRYQFNRYYSAQDTHGVACNCESVLVIDMDCVPRVGCARCTRLLRKPKESEREKRCFICSTYKRLSQGRERPAKNVIFNDREKKFIAEWCRREKAQNRKLSREAVEAQILADDTARWKRQELTDEEYDMIDEKALRITNRDSKGKLTPNEQKLRGEKIAAQLQPFVLPHFTKCQCRNYGCIPRLSKNRDKQEWTKEEQVEWRDLIIEHDGKQDLVGEILKVETELVERFASKYKNDELWKGFSFPRFARRYKGPAIGLPPTINLGDSSSSRDGSPYLPPEEMKAAKRARRN